MSKSFAVFFHYNKPASQIAGKPQVSVHFQNQCHVVDNVRCYVSTFGRVRRTAPKFVMTCQAHDVSFDDGEAIIV